MLSAARSRDDLVEVVLECVALLVVKRLAMVTETSAHVLVDQAGAKRAQGPDDRSRSQALLPRPSAVAARERH